MIDNIKQAIALHRRLLAEFEATQTGTVQKIANLICESIEQGGCLYLCGNGGSAADAQHISGELVGRFMRQRKGFPAVALTTDTSVITSVANDYTFEHIFSRQVEALVRPGDVFWGISTSGTSANVLAAAKVARQQGACLIAFTGKKSTPLETMSDLCLWVDAPYASAAQEIHQIAYHLICDLVEERLCQTLSKP